MVVLLILLLLLLLLLLRLLLRGRVGRRLVVEVFFVAVGRLLGARGRGGLFAGDPVAKDLVGGGERRVLAGGAGGGRACS